MLTKLVNNIDRQLAVGSSRLKNTSASFLKCISRFLPVNMLSSNPRFQKATLNGLVMKRSVAAAFVVFVSVTRCLARVGLGTDTMACWHYATEEEKNQLLILNLSTRVDSSKGSHRMIRANSANC